MSEKRISYITRDYNGCRNAVLDIIRNYYPDIFARVDDASIGQWLIDVIADVYDSLNFHADRLYQETTIDSAAELSSIQNIARTNGLKIPGKKSALVEIEISCNLPMNNKENEIKKPDEDYCPFIKKGSLVSTGDVTFEIMEDVDFKSQFNSDGYSNRKMIPQKNSNGQIVGYRYSKLVIASAGQSKIFKKIITNSDIKPFMEITLQDKDILGVESVIVKKGTNFIIDPSVSDFMIDEEKYFDPRGVEVHRYFEVNNLIDQYRFGDVVEETIVDGVKYYNPVSENVVVPIYDNDDKIGDAILQQVRKGIWKRLKHKFVTEYTDDWKLKLIFGTGLENSYGEIPQDAENFTKYMMSRMSANDYMGVLPEPGSTLYVLYRTGGGEQSNVAKGTVNTFTYLNVEIDGNCDDSLNSRKIRDVKNSITVTNTTPSYGGKDEPNENEIKYLVKYGQCAQNRCVTVDDYYAQLQMMPAKYGSPFRMGVVEENNKIMVYTLGLDSDGKLTNLLAEVVGQNMKEYLKQYKCVNDFVEIRSGRIINLKFRINVIIDKSYEKNEVIKRIIDLVYDYMDIHKHQMGEDIYLGDLQKELNKLDGVKNLIDIKVYNLIGEGYSDDATTQELVSVASCCYDEYEEDGVADDMQLNLKASDFTLVGDPVSMFEIKNKSKDIEVIAKTR